MKRFHFAIKALELEKQRSVGKIAIKCIESNHDPMFALEASKVKNINKAIEILTNHELNTYV